MKINIEVDIMPFDVPLFVQVIPKGPLHRGESSQTIKIEDLDPCTLEKLCDDFRHNVFSMANKTPPPTQAYPIQSAHL